MNLTPAQSAIATDKHRFRVVNCGRRFGKTTLSVYEMVGKALSQDDRRIVYIAPTYQQARDIAWQELKRICLPVAITVNESRLEITIRTTKGGESIIWLRGWESIETLRGQKFDFVVIDEVAMMRNFIVNFEEVIRPTLTDRKGDVMFISTPKGFNHFYDLYCKEQDPIKGADYKSFHFTSYDNPHLPVEELDRAKLELSEDRFSQEYLADFRKMEGLVYKEFNRQVHVYSDKEIRGYEKILGIDFGYTNPTAILTIIKDYDANYWVTDEYYKTGKTNAEVIEYIKTLGANTVYPDPAEPDRIEEMRRNGINVRDVSKDVEKGIDSVRNLIKNGRLKIHSSCVNLIAELETYAYKAKKADSNEPEEPIKENDHALDALRYALFMQQPVIKRQLNQTTKKNFR